MSTFIKDFIERETVSRRNFLFAAAAGLGAAAVPGLFDSFLAGYPLGRIGTSDDIAAAAVFLASDECFMTGENLQVNGGLTLRRNPTRAEMAAAMAKGG